VRVLAAVDVARRHFRDGEIVVGHRHLGAVVRDAADAFERAGEPAIEHDDLAAAGGGVPRVRRRLAVEAEIAVGLLDDAVRLARDHERVLGQADVQRLPAAAQREQHFVGVRRGLGGNGDGALEAGDGVPERLGEVVALAETVRDERRDHLRVGRDLGRDTQVVRGLQIGEVVDVAVQLADHVRLLVAIGLLGVERVRVRLADDADARPTGVAEHDGVGRVRLQREPQ
jgi:hypothetical protein